MQSDRRRFIKTSATAATALLLSKLQAVASDNVFTMTTDKKSDLKILATNWGFNGNLNEYCAKVKKEGYDGIEIWWPLQKQEQDELFNTLKKYDLEVGFLCGGSEPQFQQHLEHFKKMTIAAATNKVQAPLYINCHSGRDFFSDEENQAFVDHTTQLSKDSGILICHETHRSRMLFAAPVTRRYIERNPALRLTFDVSHWCNVSESLLQDQPENVALALERTSHIHARIGHPEGPQVNDPRAPEWESTVKAHLTWWDTIAARTKKNGERLTILTEFGPPDYMPVMPYTRQPLSDQWGINVYMMHLLRERYLSL